MEFSSRCVIPLLVTLMGLVALGQAGGVEDFECSTNPNTKLQIACDTDCQQQHGMDTGYCGNVTAGDFNCYCDGRSGRIMERSKLQCKEMNDQARQICTFDCVCNHGADGGHCMWDLGFCYCENWGKNPNNLGCPIKTVAEWYAAAKEIAHPERT